jgi:D-alanyl-D-alanine carboxypeptidase/D-alanyl-D-alanine-endopeptidase (penicillin-binding protein 4)
LDTVTWIGVKKVTSRPGLPIHALASFINADTGDVVRIDSPQLFVPGSTTKLLSTGTTLELLGADYRFHTKIYRTGPIAKNGSLEGDLVLVASGDLNLSNRIQPDGTLAFEDEDHSYGGPDSKGLAGDPLQVVREMAHQVAAKGIKSVRGRVLIDATLFPEGERELGTGVVISPIVVNDNVVDVIVGPGAKEGAPVELKIAPQTAYINIINQATTGKADSKSSIKYENEKVNPDGTRSVALTGNVPLGGKPTMAAYPVPEPSRYAATVLMEALKAEGVTSSLAAPTEQIDFKVLAAKIFPTTSSRNMFRLDKGGSESHLKVSQNLHASSMPYLLGALIAHKNQEIDQAGFDLSTNS